LTGGAMAKDFAKKFYNSKQWQDFRAFIITDRYGLCEICGSPGEEVHHVIYLTEDNIDDPDITLNANNVLLLCKRCHNQEHERTYQMRRFQQIRNKSNDIYTFDEDGNLVVNKNVTIVHGAPCSGKTTYVKRHKGKYDIVVDLDYIKYALLLGDDDVADVLPWAWDVRDFLYERIAQRAKYFEHCWVIATLPKRKEREDLAQRLHANLLHIDTDKETCLLRAMTRNDVGKQRQIIEKYFENFEK